MKTSLSLPATALLLVLVLVLVSSALGACSNQQVYGAGQEIQKQECRKLPDLNERARCEKSAALSYDRYRAEAEASRPAPP